MALEGAMERLKEAYFGLEDKWYALIDKIDSKVPVYGMVDRVDKVVPSFALFLIAVALIIGALVLPLVLPSGAVLSFKVSDADGAAVENATVALYVEGKEIFSESTNDLGETTSVSLEPGTTLTIITAKQGFQDYSETIEVSESVFLYSIVLESLEEKTYTIALKDSLGQPVMKPITLSFACRNPNASPPSDMLVSNGIGTVVEPVGCNGLIASIRGDGFQFKDSVELVQNQQTIYLQEQLGETATINVRLYFNDQPVTEAVTVYLYKDNGTSAGLGPIETVTSQNGVASFARQPGTYFVKSSGYGSFAAATSPVFSVSAGELREERLDLQRNVVGTISLKIVDSVTNGLVEAASVLLRLGGEEVDSKQSNDEGLVEFPVSQDTTYSIVVDHETYCLKVVHDAVIGSSTRELELTPFTEDCGGMLKVKVLDQDGRPVRNATVGLYNENKFSVGFGNLVTDINGTAEFSRVPSGDYQAFGFKRSSSGWSDVQHFVQRAAGKTVLTVVLIAGDGAIRVNVRDKEGNPLQFAQVAFVDAVSLQAIGGGSMPVQDINGTVELVTRADKSVYIVARKQGYTDFTSVIKPVLAGSTQLFEAVLEKEILQGELEIRFKGLFKEGKRANRIAPGEKYEALFQLRIPANKNYDSVGMHLRTGKHDIMELDNIVLKEINAPGNVWVVKATSYSPRNGYDIDSGHLSSDEAKWANLRWPVFSTGLMHVTAELVVKETATIGDQLNLFYRAFGEENSIYKRNPLDNELGEAESVAGKEGLYANTKQEIFQVGAETICDESFCFSASVLDLQDELVYNTADSFSGKVLRPYKLAFTVVNNSEFETNSYLDSEIRLSNPDTGLMLQNYTVYGAQSQQKQGTAEESSTNWIEAGNLLPDNRVQGEIHFTPKRSGLSQLKIEIRSGQRVRFSKTISMNIAAAKEMDVLVSPKLLPSGIENSLTITAKDKMTGAEIDGAIAKAKDRFGTVVAEKTTNTKGIAVLRLPGLQPGEKLQLFVGKPDYQSFEKTIGVNPAVVKVKPGTIGVALNAKTTFETQDMFSVENITSFDLKIKNLELNGRLYGLVDKEKANNWLYSYVGETIKSNELREMQLLSFLTEKGKKAQQAKQLEASLDVTMQAFGSEWVENVPVKISVGLGGEVDDPACFAITRKEWKASTEGTPIEIQFEAQNNCSISGAPVSLRNVSAKVDWETNQLGTFSIRTADNALDLRTGYYKKFKGLLAPEESVSIVLTFTPNAGVNGKGIATVFLSAENPTESGPQLLSNAVAAELTVVNLADCISFSKEVLLIKPEKSDSFAIETVGCGPRNEIRLESELTLSIEKFTLGEKASKEIEVFAEKNIAGQYPIRVYAKGSDEVQEKLVKTVRVRILAGGCLELSRYEFDIFDNPENLYDGYDTVEVINHCYNKPVTVRVQYDERDWGEAMKTGAVYGLIMGTVGHFAQNAAGAEATGDAAGKEAGLKKTSTASQGSGRSLGDGIKSAGSALWGGITGAWNWITGSSGNGDQGDVSSGPGEVFEAQGNEEGAERISPTGYAAMGGGLLGGMLTNIVSGIGTSLLGPPSFWNWGIKGFIIGTVTAYMSQDEGEFSFTIIEKDLVYKDIELLMPGATLEEDRLVETPSADIVVRDLDETSTMPRPDDPRLSLEKRKMGFLNVESVVQPDPATPLYRVLKVSGERIEYRTEYDLDEKKTPSLEVRERKQHKERFRLQFNAFDPLIVRPDTKPIPNCTLGSVVGVTGPNAVPKIAFDWSWSKIDEDSCNEGNEDYIYCDATQFSIAILEKVQKLREFIELNKPFKCPSSASAVSVKEQPLLGTAYDIGITRLQGSKTGASDVNLVAVVESNNGRSMDAELTISMSQEGGLAKRCTRQFELISKSIVSCEFTGLADGEYTVEAGLVPTLCNGCENSDESNDSIDVKLLIQREGVAECSPYNTKRLVRFLEASNYSQPQIEEVQKLVSFNAYLIKDAYTPDFKADFDEFCKTKSFFDCPSYYLEDDGLHRFFANERFEFDYSLAPHAPADAGKYAVTLNIEFDNENWDFFSEGMPEATISVEMTELSAPEPDSPFYYLPFDGLVGIDSENGRQGYGVNFRQTSPETIKVNNTIDQTIVTSNIAGSTPIFNGWIDAGSNDEFGILNQANRGILLNVQSGAESTKVTLSPSYATPVMMQVRYEKGQDAYGFYSVEIDQGPQSAFTKMLPWSGIGVTCKDFRDNAMTEAWQDTWDMHGGISGNLGCAIGTDITDYGIEWCNPKRVGSVYLQTVVFTPQNRNSLMKRTAYSDEMTLYNADDSGSQIALNGVPGMLYNSYGTSAIDSLEDVFELVKENKVCLIGQGNRISNRFFWNPKVVLEEISALRTNAEENCIESS